jgi:molybdate transport system substrate-binding protein
VPLAIARRANIEGPVLTEATDIASLLRGAQDIAYTSAGTSGRIYLEVLEKLGVLEEVMARSRPMSGGVPAESVAEGDVELAIAPLTTVLATPEVTPAAIFPEDLGTHIDMSVFLSSKPRIGAEVVLDFLTAKHLDPELVSAGIMRFELF